MMTYGDQYGNSVKANNFVNLRIATYLKLKLCVVVSTDTTVFPKTKYLLLHAKFGFYLVSFLNQLFCMGLALGTCNMRYAQLFEVSAS